MEKRKRSQVKRNPSSGSSSREREKWWGLFGKAETLSYLARKKARMEW